LPKRIGWTARQLEGAGWSEEIVTSDHSNELELALGRLQAVEDQFAISRTLYKYGHTYDYDDYDGWLDCFTDDAVYDVVKADGEVIIACVGRAELDVQIRGHKHALNRFTQHLLIEPLIEVDGDRATSVAYFVRTDDRESKPYISASGRYHDELRRCDDGQWRFSSRRAQMEAQDTS
jgi:hypothetical protein